MTEQWEDDLRMEAEGLHQLLSLFNQFESLLTETLEEYGESLDQNLVLLLRRNLLFVATLINEDFIFIAEGGTQRLKLEGLVHQLEDVMDEIQTLQAGKPTKEGIPDENGGSHEKGPPG